jgi:exosome complex component CSL4
MEKKLVLPGDHLASNEEAESGPNTYVEKDEVYSAAIGENATAPGRAEVKTTGRTLKQPQMGGTVYCLIFKAGMNKAVGGCISVEEAEGGKRGVQIDAVLPVTAIRRDYVRDLRDEVKIGDIVKAKIMKIEKTGFEISIKDHDCGIVAAFCPRCRSRMSLTERIFICPECGWKERRKLPLKEGEAPPPEEYRERPRREFGGREGGFRRGGFGREGERRGGFRRGGDRGGFRRGPPRRES